MVLYCHRLSVKRLLFSILNNINEPRLNKYHYFLYFRHYNQLI